MPAQKIGRTYVVNEEDLKLVADRKPGRPRKAQGQGAAKQAGKKKGK